MMTNALGWQCFLNHCNVGMSMGGQIHFFLSFMVDIIVLHSFVPVWLTSTLCKVTETTEGKAYERMV